MGPWSFRVPNIDPCLQVILELRVGLHIVDKELIEAAFLIAGSFCPGEQIGEHGARPVDLCQHSVVTVTAVPKSVHAAKLGNQRDQSLQLSSVRAYRPDQIRAL